MVVVPSSVSVVAMELWRTVGFELVVFAITLMVIIAVRTISNTRAMGVSAKKKLASLSSNPKVDEKKKKRSPCSPTPSYVVMPQSPVAKPPSLSMRMCDRNERWSRFDSTKKQGAHERFSVHSSEPSTLVNEVCDSVSKGMGARTAADVLLLYEEMKAGIPQLNIELLATRSRHTSVDFYNALTQCAVKTGKPHLIEGFLEEMRETQVLRPRTFYESAMRLLAGKKHFRQALAVYDHMVSDGIEPSAVTCSCLINFAAEVGELDRAVHFFEKLSSISVPSVRAYMTVLRVYSRRQDWTKSRETYYDMKKRGVALDSLLLNVILSTGVAADKLEGVEELIEEASRNTTPIVDVVSYNTLIKGYAQRSEAAKAILVLTRMRERGLKPNAITYNTAMDAAVRRSLNTEAWEVFGLMKESGLRPDKFTCSILIKGLQEGATREQVASSLELLRLVDAPSDSTLRATLFASVIDAASRLTDTSLLMKAFAQMQKQRVEPTAQTYRFLIQALDVEGDLQRCSQVWDQMLAEGVRPQASVFIALLEAYLRHGRASGALSAFASIRASFAAQPGESHSETVALLEECRGGLIRALCRSRHEEEASLAYNQARKENALSSLDGTTMMLLTRMQADAGNVTQAATTIDDMLAAGHKPNEATIQSFLTACIKESRADLGKACAVKLQSSSHGESTRLAQATYALLIKLYGRCQQLDDAFETFDNMTQVQGLEPSAATYTCLLRACLQSRQTGRALEVFEQMKAQLAPSRPDGSTYRLMIGGCASGGLLQKGFAVLEEAVQSGTVLPADSAEQLAQVAGRKRQSSDIFEKIQQLARDNGLSLVDSPTGSTSAPLGSPHVGNSFLATVSPSD